MTTRFRSAAARNVIAKPHSTSKGSLAGQKRRTRRWRCLGLGALPLKDWTFPGSCLNHRRGRHELHPGLGTQTGEPSTK